VEQLLNLKQINSMALILEANYSKKLGLPGYSSHQYSVTVRTELVDLSQVQLESTRLYTLLQNSVDQELKKSGFLPNTGILNGHSIGVNGANHKIQNGNGGNGAPDSWNCSPKQKELIHRILTENKLDPSMVEQLARTRFGKGVKALDKLEASGLIDELLESHPNGHRSRFQRAGGR
jgi:hypothetical protein